MEGQFALRYRLFSLDLTSPEIQTRPVISKALAECWGQPFRVFPPKEFPLLDSSTPLSKVMRTVTR